MAALIKAIQIVQLTIAASSQTATATLTGFTDLDQMTCFPPEIRAPDLTGDISKNEIDADAWPSAVNEVTLQRGASPPATSLTATVVVIQWVDAVNVFKGTWSMTSSETSDLSIALGGTVTLANTWGWHCRRGDSGTMAADSRAQGRLTRFWFPSTSTVSVERYGAYGATEGHWFAVEHTDLTVEHGSDSQNLPSEFTVTWTITSVTLAETLLSLSMRANTSSNVQSVGAWDLQNSTTLRMRRGTDIRRTIDIEYQIVSSSAFSVQRGDFAAGTSDNDTITSVASHAFAKSGSGTQGDHSTSDGTSGTLDRRYWEIWLSNDTTVNGQCGDAPSDGVCTWEVVEIDKEAAANDAQFLAPAI